MTDDFVREENHPALKKHLGTISLALGVGLFLLNMLAWGVGLVLAIRSPGEGSSWIFQVLGVFFAMSVLGHLAGLVLGIVALARDEPRRVLGLLGALVNGVLLLGIAALLALSVLGASV